MSWLPDTKRQRSETLQYELLYHPGIPGRGEFIRLAFHATNTPYTDPANDNPPGKSSSNGYGLVQAAMDPTSTGDASGNPPALCPPILRIHRSANAPPLVLHQTPNILLYLGPRLGLVGDGDDDLYRVNQLALTALDLNNEAHDTHHPVAVAQYYEDQKPEALKKARDFRENRIPKFLSFYERVLAGNAERHGGDGKGKRLVGRGLTYADLCLWQVLDGLMFAFPHEMEARKAEFPGLFGTFYPGIKDEEWMKAYLGSGKRKPYSMGVFRHYPELDRQ